MTQSRPPATAQTLQALTAFLKEGGDAEALVGFTKEKPKRWTYERLGSEIEALARGLSAAAVGPRSRVVVIGPNRPPWVIAALAVLRTGSVLVPVDPQMPAEALRQVLDDADPALVLAGKSELERVRSQRPDLALGVLSLDDEGGLEQPALGKWMRDSGDRSLVDVEPEDVAVLFYTSGTTGPPKGVPLTHANLGFQIRFLTDSRVVRSSDRMLVPLPFHHAYPFVLGLLAPFANRLAVILPWALTGPEISQALRSGHATVILGVPRLYEALVGGLLRRIEEKGRVARLGVRALLQLAGFLRHRLRVRTGHLLFRPLHRQLGPDLRMLVSGGAALDPELAWTLEAFGWRVATGYGLTETAPLLTWNPPGEGRLDSAGRPIEGVEIRIDTEVTEDRSRGDARLGEVLARGPNVFSGYHRLADETRKALTEDGWFRTGDLGRLDEDGYLHLAGRVSTMIVTKGGENVQPEHVEKAYAAHPFIQEMAVFGRDGRIVGLIVPDREALSAQAKDDIDAAIAQAVREVARSLPSYQQLSDYAVTREALPRTRLGKPRRHLLAERFDKAKTEGDRAVSEERRPMTLAEMSAEDRSLLDEPATRKTWERLAERFGDRRLTPDSDLRLDLGVDSMEWLNLTMDLAEHANVVVDDEAIGDIATIRDLLQEVAQTGETDEATVFPLEDPESILGPEQTYWLRPLNSSQTALSWLLYWLNRVVMRAVFRLEVNGLDHLPDTGPLVLAPNHVSLLDPPALGAALDYQFLQRTYWAGWTGIVFKTAVRSGLSRLARAVPVDPQRAAGKSLALAGAILRRRLSLVWFPEGERSATGQLQGFKPGIGLLLDRFRVPVVPILIEGTYRALPRGRALPRPGKVAVTFFEAVDPATLEREGQGDTSEKRITAALYRRMSRLMP